MAATSPFFAMNSISDVRCFPCFAHSKVPNEACFEEASDIAEDFLSPIYFLAVFLLVLSLIILYVCSLFSSYLTKVYKSFRVVDGLVRLIVRLLPFSISECLAGKIYPRC